MYRGRRYGASFLKDIRIKESFIKKIAPSENPTWLQTIENSAMLGVSVSRLSNKTLQKLDSPDKVILIVSSVFSLYETSAYLCRLVKHNKKNDGVVDVEKCDREGVC